MEPTPAHVERLIVIGASTGGPPALHMIFKAIAKGSRAAIVVAQHMPKNFTQAFANRLGRLSHMPIVQAQHGMSLHPGCAYVAPGGRHLELRGSAEHMWCVLRGQDTHERWVPSVDRLFTSASAVMGANMLAVVLTGMGSDGALGVTHVFNGGGQVFCESEETAIVYGMPKEAALTGCAHAVLPLSALVAKIKDFARGA